LPVDEVIRLLLRVPAIAWQPPQKERFFKLHNGRPVIRKSPYTRPLLDKLGREPAEV
jgi:hypothetical protein